MYEDIAVDRAILPKVILSPTRGGELSAKSIA